MPVNIVSAAIPKRIHRKRCSRKLFGRKIYTIFISEKKYHGNNLGDKSF